MYRQGPNIEVRGSPSLLLNNLSVGSHVVFADVDKVHVMDFDDGRRRSVSATVLEAKICDDRLVAAGVGRIETWRLSDLSRLATHAVRGFARGIATTGGKIFVGQSDGSVFCVDDDRTVTAHKSALAALAARESLVATADDQGEIRLWDAPRLEPSHKLDVGRTDQPVTSLALPNDSVCCAGFATGHLRIYKIQHRAGLVAELGAHTRCITAISALHNKVATVSEDTYLHVWHIDDDDLHLLFSHSIPNALLTGVQFMPNHDLLVAAYETDHIYKFVS